MARIKYGVSNVHYAVATTDATTGAITYGTVKPLPGCVSLALDQQVQLSVNFHTVFHSPANHITH